MRKIYIIMGAILLLAILTTGVWAVFNNRADALSYFNTLKDTQDSNIATATKSIRFTTDKECEIVSESETRCQACFTYSYTIDKQTFTGNECVDLPPEQSEAEDNEHINVYIENMLYDVYKIKPVKYTERSLTGTTTILS